mgnify:CR=1 FL=1
MLINYQKANIYQDEKLVLENVDFQVNEGEFIYLIGRVGSGKSSLLKTIYCELDIDPEDAERADVLGESVLALRRSRVPALRKQMGIIFQDFRLIPTMTVYENIAFAMHVTNIGHKQIKERVNYMLELVHLEDKAKVYPELSGGEQQRIAIARALLNKPKIIIADEPTGNLDPETAASIVSLLQAASKEGTAVVMSTHNIHLIDLFPGKVYRCKNRVFSLIDDGERQREMEEEDAEEMAQKG